MAPKTAPAKQAKNKTKAQTKAEAAAAKATKKSAASKCPPPFPSCAIRGASVSVRPSVTIALSQS